MIENVARAICIANRDDPDKVWLCIGERQNVIGWQEYEADARAAIAAMREPDRCAVKAMCKAMSPEHRPTFEWVSAAEKHRIRWRAAIDRVLSDGEAA